MKKLTLLLILCFFSNCKLLYAQFSDDFSDGDFTSNPLWIGDVAEFQINSNQALQSQGPAATSKLHLVTANRQLANTVWEFWLKLDFSPSTSNFVQIYLTSDQADLEGSLNGYYIRIGESGSGDGIDLYRQEGTITSKIIDGNVSVLSNATTNQARIRVTRDVLGNWLLEADGTGGSNFVQEGRVVDNTITATSFFGVVCSHTSSRSASFFFDDFEVKNAGLSLVSATAVSMNQVAVRFSEAVHPSTAETLTNYSLNNGLGHPIAAQVDANNGALVYLSYPMLNTGSYELTVNNVSALVSNQVIANNSTTTFNFTAPIPFKNIVINEIFADVSPPVALPEVEFIELYNPTNQDINLLGATFSDGSSTATFSSSSIAAESYLIVCNSNEAAILAPFGTVIGLSNFPTLNNGGETLILRGATGTVIDSVSYETSWYKDTDKDDGGYTLELINPLDTCITIAENWSASIDESGGTPGKQNTIFDNTLAQTAPVIISTEVMDSESLLVQFDQRMDENSLKNANFLLSSGNTNFRVQTIEVSSSKTTLKLTVDVLTIGQLYTLQIEGAISCSQIALPSTAFNFAYGQEPNFHELIITEILADPNPVLGLPDTEYIELYNTTSSYISLDNLVLRDVASTAAFPNTVIAPQSYLLIASADEIDLFSQANKLGLEGFPSLTNAGEPLIVSTTSGKLIFEITYSMDWFEDSDKAAGGFSLEMIDLNSPCLEARNWQGSNDPKGGTPGATNSVSDRISDNFPPELLRAYPIAPNSIRLEFNEKLDSASTQNATISIDQNITISARVFSIPNTKELTLVLNEDLADATSYILTISNLADCSGNLMTTTSSATIQLPQIAEIGDLLINEVVPDAFTGGARYVEIYNNSAKYISLLGWQLGVENSLGTIGTGSGQRTILRDEEWILAPNEYVVFTDEPTVIQNDYPSGRHERILAVSSSSFLTLDVTDEDKRKLVLIDNGGNEMDRVELMEEMYFGLLDDVNGVALERVSFTGSSNDVNNWASAAENVGFGTPGYLNSQHIDNPKGKLGTSCFELTPDIFSPDNDGFDDVLTIHYTCNQNNLVANMVIYDANGREIKRLSQNQLLSTSGFISWDGIGDNGEKAQIGYYVLFIETFGLNGEIQRQKKSFAVGGKF